MVAWLVTWTLLFVLVTSLIFGYATRRAIHAADSVRSPSTNGCAVRSTLVVELPVGAAGRVALRSFESIGAIPIGPDRPEQVCARRRPNLHSSWGDILTAWLTPLDDTTTQIVIESCPVVSLAVYDWGRNRSNVDRIRDAILAATASTSDVA